MGLFVTLQIKHLYQLLYASIKVFNISVSLVGKTIRNCNQNVYEGSSLGLLDFDRKLTVQTIVQKIDWKNIQKSHYICMHFEHKEQCFVNVFVRKKNTVFVKINILTCFVQVNILQHDTHIPLLYHVLE